MIDVQIINIILNLILPVILYQFAKCLWKFGVFLIPF